MVHRMEDEAAGEIPAAFVVRTEGSKISEDDIKKYISDQVSVFIFYIFSDARSSYISTLL